MYLRCIRGHEQQWVEEEPRDSSCRVTWTIVRQAVKSRFLIFVSDTLGKLYLNDGHQVHGQLLVYRLIPRRPLRRPDCTAVKFDITDSRG